MKQQISTNQAPATPSLLSQGIAANGFIFTGGFIHTSPEGVLVNGTTEVKVKQIMRNLEAVLLAGGATFNDVVKVTVYVTDIAELAVLNKIYPSYFTQPLPAREGICVKALPLGASIEISMVAVQP